MKRYGMIILTSILVVGVLAGSALASPGTVIYNSIPESLPGNVRSQAFEATSTSEFGDHIQFTTGSGRALETVTVALSSWGCESGAWTDGSCMTTPGATFSHPITLNLYEVVMEGGVPTLGEKFATQTITFDIPYRPSADPVDCPTTPEKWYSPADHTCYNGYATLISFDFTGQGVTLPDDLIWGIAYNTTHYGYNPIGESAPCYHEDGGCGYDSLNVGADTLGELVGTDVEPDSAFLNSTWNGAYCDGGAGGTGSFRFDQGCWTGYRPQIRITAQEFLGDCLVEKDYENLVYTMLSDCTTDETVWIEDGWTFDGNGYKITAIDPQGGHFLGAVLQNAGDMASVIDVEITASNLANVCDSGADRLRGILFDGAGGSITNNYVHGVRQGLSGCQEGNAIEVRNFDQLGNPMQNQVVVTISGNTVEDYQKNGITVNGSVAAKVAKNQVEGDGRIDYTAQNGIQIGFGAQALVTTNSASSNWYTPRSYVACGLLLYEAGGVKQQHNSLTNNERNLCNYGRGGGNFGFPSP